MAKTKDKLTKQGEIMLKKVKKIILEEPKRLDMGQWGVVYSKALIKRWSKRKIEHEMIPSCGTVGCIAGWTVMLHDEKLWNRLRREANKPRVGLEYLGSSAERKAAEILGVSLEKVQRLFYVQNWPKKFYCKYDEAETLGSMSDVPDEMDKHRKDQAKVTAERIDHFIKTGR